MYMPLLPRIFLFHQSSPPASRVHAASQQGHVQLPGLDCRCHPLVERSSRGRLRVRTFVALSSTVRLRTVILRNFLFGGLPLYVVGLLRVGGRGRRLWIFWQSSRRHRRLWGEEEDREGNG